MQTLWRLLTTLWPEAVPVGTPPFTIQMNNNNILLQSSTLNENLCAGLNWDWWILLLQAMHHCLRHMQRAARSISGCRIFLFKKPTLSSPPDGQPTNNLPLVQPSPTQMSVRECVWDIFRTAKSSGKAKSLGNYFVAFLERARVTSDLDNLEPDLKRWRSTMDLLDKTARSAFLVRHI